MVEPQGEQEGRRQFPRQPGHQDQQVPAGERTAMRRGGKEHRLTTFQAGLVALAVILLGAYLGFTKDIPFTKPFQVQAVFENAPPSVAEMSGVSR